MNNIEPLIPTTKAAELLGVSRVTVFKWIQSGKLPAKKYGRNYLIAQEDLESLLLSHELTDDEKKEITRAVKKAVDEYGEVFRLLGKE